MTIHPQDELAADPAILRTAARLHGAYVGLFAAVGAPGCIRVGDPGVAGAPPSVGHTAYYSGFPFSN